MGTCFYYLLFQQGEFQIANFIVRLLTTAVTFKATSGLLIAFKDKVHKRKISLFYYFCVVKISNESESNFVYSQFSNLFSDLSFAVVNWECTAKVCFDPAGEISC